MKALILYVVFTVIGGVGSALIGVFVERETSSALSLIVFLTLFFTNFVVSWILVILVMDGNLRTAQGGQAQLDIENRGESAVNSK